MSDDLIHALSSLAKTEKLVAPIVQETPETGRRGHRLADTLRTLWPCSGLAACLMDRDGTPLGTALDSSGAARPDWSAALAALLLGNDGSPATLPATIRLPGHELALHWIDLQDHAVGLIALAVPRTLAAEIRGILDMCLSICASQLSLHLLLESNEQSSQRLADEIADLNWLANIGEMTGPIIHEFNNYLNISLLNVSILERKLDKPLGFDLASVRQQGVEAAALIRHLQDYRQHNRPNHRLVDLNQVIREVLAETGSCRSLDKEDIDVRFEPGLGLPNVLGSCSDLKRLLRLLLANSAAANSGRARVRIRTGADDAKVWLRVEDAGPPIHPERLPHLFDSRSQIRPGAEPLELAACKSLVRRQRGSLHAEGTGLGLAIIAELPVANTALAARRAASLPRSS